MLKKIHRLTSNRDFKLVFKNGRSFETEFIKLKIASNKKDVSRFGFIVSAKIAPKAHDRNLVKRRLRSAVRFLLPNIQSGFDVAIWPKAKVKGIEFQVLIDSLKNLFKKSLIWQEI